MLKKTVQYTDFNGDEVEEDFYFNLSKAELVELEVRHEGGMVAALQRIITAVDREALIKEFKYILLISYGRRSDDGRRFVKTQEYRDEFVSSEAYSTLFMELITDEDAAIAFMNGIVPEDMSLDESQVAQIDPKKTPLTVLDATKDADPVDKDGDKPEPGEVTRAELTQMSSDDYIRTTQAIGLGYVKIVD